MSLKTLSSILCIFCVSSMLFLLSTSMFGDDRKKFISVFGLVLLFDPMTLLLSFKSSSVFVQLSFTLLGVWFFSITDVCAAILFVCVCCLYRINVYINYIKCCCIWHTHQHLTIPGNCQKFTLLFIIFVINNYNACS